MEAPQLWVLVGGNGAGKSTFYRLALEPLGIPFVNADLIARAFYPDAPEENSLRAAHIAGLLRDQLVARQESFCYETVFSHPSKIDALARAKAVGYQIVMVVIHLTDIALNKARVSQRVEEGGHDVPEDRIESRVPRTLHHVAAALDLCDEVHFIDNSSAEDPLRVVARLERGMLDRPVSDAPEWVRHIICGR